MTTQALNQQKAEEFGAKMVGVMNSAATALMISIGHQTGLFDKMANLPPATSQQLATAAKLHERYVREWLQLNQRLPLPASTVPSSTLTISSRLQCCPCAMALASISDGSALSISACNCAALSR